MEIELPDPPDPIPVPRLWPAVLMTLAVWVAVMFMYVSSVRMVVFYAGAIAATSGMQMAHAIAIRQRARKLQAQLDELYAMAKERVIMLPALVERHGPEDAIEIMRAADHLVEEGDFPDIRAAVAAIERHHDWEPTFEEGSQSD